MDLVLGIILIVLAFLFILFGVICLVFSDGEENAVGVGCGMSLGGVVLIVIGIIFTVYSSQNYSTITNQIMTYRDAEHFTIGMVRGKSYQMFDYNTKILIEKPVSFSTIIKDEDECPYIVETKHIGDRNTYYYIHVPADVIILAM